MLSPSDGGFAAFLSGGFAIAEANTAARYAAGCPEKDQDLGATDFGGLRLVGFEVGPMPPFAAIPLLVIKQ